MANKSDQSPTAGSVEYLVQFLHPEKMLELAPGHAPLSGISAVYFGIDDDAVATMRDRSRHAVRSAAEELLEDETFADAVARLPFGAGERVVAYGDSFTDDWQSWAHLLSEVLSLARGPEAAEVVNLGRSSDTTSNLMQRFPAVAEKSPAWLIMMIGVNDAKHMRLASTVPIVSALETKRNVEALQEMATAIGARAIWLVPPYHDEVALRDSPFISGAPVSWNMEDMVAMREVLLETCPDPLDLAPIFTYGDGLRMDDGVHPTLKGQQAILRDLCSFLADRA